MVSQLAVFVEILTVGKGVSLTLLLALGSLFFQLGYLVQLRYEGLCSVLSNLVILCLVDITGKPALS